MFPALPTEANRGPNLLIAEWLTLAVALIAVGLRLHGRCISLNIPGWDDHTILAATAFGVAQAVISIIQVDNRFGQHAATLAPPQISATIMWTTINAMLQTLGTLLVRLSACLLVLRMPPVGHTKQLHARAIHMLMVFFVLISAASFLLLCFHCTPIESLWDRTVHARCISMQTWCTIQKVDGIFQVLMNFLTASLPFVFLRNLQTRLREKCGVMAIAFLAYCTAGVTICRVHCGIVGDDLSWDLACVQICLSIEQNIGTVITSIPTLGDPLFIFLNHTRTSLLGRYFWPNPPLPSCWADSQSDDIHLQNFPHSPDWQFDPESGAADEDADFWHAVDLQMGDLSFDACARPEKTYHPSKPSSRQPSKTRSRWGSRYPSRWGSRSSSPKSNRKFSNHPKGSLPKSTTPKGTPPKSTTPTCTPPKSTTPTSTPPKSNTPGSSKYNSRMHSRRPSIDRSPGSSDRRSFRSMISRPSSWMRWSWRTGDDPGYEP